jgi:hypothetical protein
MPPCKSRRGKDNADTVTVTGTKKATAPDAIISTFWNLDKITYLH